MIAGRVRISGTFAVIVAVSVAGGLSKFGGKSKVEILRKTSDGGTKRIKVDLGDIEGGKKPDVPLESQDIIKVGKRVF